MHDNFCPVGKTREGMRINASKFLMIFEKDICIAASKNCSCLLDLEFPQVLGIRFEHLLDKIAPKLTSKAKSISRNEADKGTIFFKKIFFKDMPYELLIYEVQGKVYVEIAGLDLKRKIVKKKLSKLHTKLKKKLRMGAEPQKVLQRYAPKILQTLRAQGIIYKQRDKITHFGNIAGENAVMDLDQLSFNLERLKDGIQPIVADLCRTDQFDEVVSIVISPLEDCCMYIFKVLNFSLDGLDQVDTLVENKVPSVGLGVSIEPSSLESKESVCEEKREKWARYELKFLEKLGKAFGKSLEKNQVKRKKVEPKTAQSNVIQRDSAYFLKHDLKNPLTTITLAAQMLIQNKKVPEKFVDRSLHNILESAKALSEMIDKMYTKAD